MKYDLKLSVPELNRLREVEGRPLLSVSTEGWAIYLTFADARLSFLPEEFPTPDAAHPHGDAVRIRVAPTPDDEPPSSFENVLARDLGSVRRISLLVTAVTASPPRPGAAFELLGQTIPAGIDYHPIYLHPLDPAVPALIESESTGIAMVDVGVLIETVANRLFIATDACGYFVYATTGHTIHERHRSLQDKLLLESVADRLAT